TTARPLVLRMCKTPPNQAAPPVSPPFSPAAPAWGGADTTSFESPGGPPGHAGDGMVHRVAFRVGSEASLDFWESRVGGERTNGSLVFDDPEGLTLELTIDEAGDAPLVARHPEIPAGHALPGFDRRPAYPPGPGTSAP